MPVYSNNGKNLSAMVHAGRAHTAPCGRVIYGNGGMSAHQNRCRACLTTAGAYMPKDVQHGLWEEHRKLPLAERLRKYEEWQREEAVRLLAEMDQPKGRNAP